MNEGGEVKDRYLDIGGGPDLEIVEKPKSSTQVVFAGFDSEPEDLQEHLYRDYKTLHDRTQLGLNFRKRAELDPNSEFFVVDPVLDEDLITKIDQPVNLHFIKGMVTERSDLPIKSASMTGVEVNRLFTPIVQGAMERIKGQNSRTVTEFLEKVARREMDYELMEPYIKILGAAVRVLKPGGKLILREKANQMAIIRTLLASSINELGMSEEKYIDLDLEDHGEFSRGSIWSYNHALEKNDQEWIKNNRPTSLVLLKAA